MLLAALPIDEAMQAALLLGAPTSSYQSPGATFSKLFAVFPSFTMTGLALELTDNNHRELIRLEERLLASICHLQRGHKAPVTGIDGHIASYTRGSHSWSAPEGPRRTAMLIRIVGVWDTDTEFGLIYKLTPAEDAHLAKPPRSVRGPLLASAGDLVHSGERQADGDAQKDN